MKNILIAMIVLALALLPAFALAEDEWMLEWQNDDISEEEAVQSPTPSTDVPGVTLKAIPLEGDVVFTETLNAMGYKPEGGETYQLIGADGAPAAGVEYIGMKSHYNGYLLVTVPSSDGIHGRGLLDADGREIIPPEYADINIISDRWQAGVVVKEISGNVARPYIYVDPETNAKRYYAVDHADLYLRGRKVGSMDGTSYGYGDITGMGDYLAVKRLQGGYVYYGPDLARSPATSDSYYTEFDSNYVDSKQIYTHMGTGQRAFEPGCTLTADEVDSPLKSDYHGNVMDLQGNVVYRAGSDDSYLYLGSFDGDYATIELDDKEGLIDRNGRIVIPMEYDRVGEYENNPLRFGSISIENDGLCGFMDAQGRRLVDTVYPAKRIDIRANMATMENLDGSTTVITGEAGELDERFDYVYGHWEGASAFAAQRDKQWAVVDMRGRHLVDYMDARNITVNSSGTMALVNLDNGRFLLICIDRG